MLKEKVLKTIAVCLLVLLIVSVLSKDFLVLSSVNFRPVLGIVGMGFGIYLVYPVISHSK